MMYSIHTLHPEATVSCCPYLPDKPHCCWKFGMRREKESEKALSYFYWFSGWLKARQVAFHWVRVSPEASRSLEPSPDYRVSLKVFYDHVKANTSKNMNSSIGNLKWEIFQNPLYWILRYKHKVTQSVMLYAKTCITEINFLAQCIGLHTWVVKPRHKWNKRA